MLRYLLRVSYDGSKYYGFQRLPKLPSVQSELEQAISKVFKEKIEIKGAGRTDRGVHALDQCVSFDAPFEIKEKDLKLAINRHLSEYIHVTEAKKVSDLFHARFSVKKKVYEYKINIGKYDPLYSSYYYQPKKPINIKGIKKASKVFIGLHDFKNFVSGEHEKTISRIYKIRIMKKNNILTIRIVGTNFYKYMVRNIVGAMLDYSSEKVSINDLKEMLNNPKKKRQLSTACPNGLYLVKIYY